MTELKIYNTPVHVAREFADLFYTLFKQYQDEDKLMHVALSGGSTPKLFFKLLVERFKDIIDWNIIHFYWGDERMVPSTDAESNYGEAIRFLFDKISIPKSNIHPIRFTNQPKDEIKHYAELLAKNLDMSNGNPVFDLVILGMGDDGHTASIFPNQMELFHSDAVCELAYHPETGQPRITLTGRVINNAKNVVFLITGEKKAAVLRSVFNQDESSKNYPATYVQPTSDQLFFFVDSEAAQNIF